MKTKCWYWGIVKSSVQRDPDFTKCAHFSKESTYMCINMCIFVCLWSNILFYLFHPAVIDASCKGTRKMVLWLCFIERISLLFSSVCPLSPTYVMDTHIHTLPGNMRKPDLFLPVRSSLWSFSWSGVSVCKHTHTKMHRHRNKPTHVYASICMDEQVGIHPCRHTDVHTETNTHIYAHLPSYWVNKLLMTLVLMLKKKKGKKTLSSSPPTSTQDVTAIDHFPVDIQRQCQHE